MIGSMKCIFKVLIFSAIVYFSYYRLNIWMKQYPEAYGVGDVFFDMFLIHSLLVYFVIFRFNFFLYFIAPLAIIILGVPFLILTFNQLSDVNLYNEKDNSWEIVFLSQYIDMEKFIHVLQQYGVLPHGIILLFIFGAFKVLKINVVSWKKRKNLVRKDLTCL